MFNNTDKEKHPLGSRSVAFDFCLLSSGAINVCFNHNLTPHICAPSSVHHISLMKAERAQKLVIVNTSEEDHIKVSVIKCDKMSHVKGRHNSCSLTNFVGMEWKRCGGGNVEAQDTSYRSPAAVMAHASSCDWLDANRVCGRRFFPELQTAYTHQPIKAERRKCQIFDILPAGEATFKTSKIRLFQNNTVHM